jgi:arylsulfatase A-like enzyme
MTDEWLGRFLGKLDEYKLWDDTCVIITADHGHELGEKGRFGKQPPMFDLSAHIPLLIWRPEYNAPKRTNALTTTADLYPTILETLGASYNSPHGRSLTPLLHGETETHRNLVSYGFHGAGVTATTAEYSYHTSWDGAKPLYAYSASYSKPDAGIVSGRFIGGVDSPVWKIPAKSMKPYPELLFDRKTDPFQERNVLSEKPEIRNEMRQKLIGYMREINAPEEQYARLMLT